MLIRSLGDAGGERPVKSHFAGVTLPLRISPALARTAFLDPLSAALREDGLGAVTGHKIACDDTGETETLKISLDLVSVAPEALERVGHILEGLDAPVGSAIETADGTKQLTFGRSHGLGLYLPNRDADEAGRLAVAEACTDAMAGSGLFQGTARVGDRTALYFYGDSFNRMRSAVTFVMTHDPRCRNAYARRLNEG